MSSGIFPAEEPTGEELRERYLWLLRFARLIERYSYYQDGPGYYREGDVANGAFTREAVLSMREKLRDWFPEAR